MKKEAKVKDIIQKLEGLNYYVEQYANGHIKVLDVNFWCTTEKWHDAKNNVKGLGIRTYLEYLMEVDKNANK